MKTIGVKELGLEEVEVIQCFNGYTDSIGRRKATDGEKIEIVWPDNTKTTHVLKVVEREVGCDLPITDSIAYIDLCVRGQKITVPLRDIGLKVRRV